MSEEKIFSEETTGISKPRSFMVDSSILEQQEEHNLIREEIRLHRVIFNFPEGVNDIDLFDRCRLLYTTEDYETAYVTVLSMLEGKPVQVLLKPYDGSEPILFTEFQVVDKEQNLAQIPDLNEYPIIINWLIDYMVAREEKKYPLPLLQKLVEVKAEENPKKKKKNLKT